MSAVSLTSSYTPNDGAVGLTAATDGPAASIVSLNLVRPVLTHVLSPDLTPCSADPDLTIAHTLFISKISSPNHKPLSIITRDSTT